MKQRSNSQGLPVGRTLNSSYLHDALNPKRLHSTVNLCARLARKLQPDTIVGRGLSGTLVGLPLAMKLGIHFAYVRKVEHNSHCSSGIEGPCDLGRFIIVDDFIHTGRTLTTIMKSVDDHDRNKIATLVGTILYNENRFLPTQNLRDKINNALGEIAPVGIVHLDPSPVAFFIPDFV